MKIKRSLIFISILSVFIAFLFVLIPRAQIVSAATTTSPQTGTETSVSPPGSTTTPTTTADTTKTNTATNTTTAATTAPTDTKATTPANSTTEPSTLPPRVELSVTGLGSADASVTNMDGVPITPNDNLYTWLNFRVNYEWSIPDGVQINAGDTVPFQLPEGVVASGDLSFPIYDSNGTEIGTATIANGEVTGNITFNDSLSNTDTNRHGTLSLIAKGTNTGNGNEGMNWMFNKVGWIGGYDPSGVPNEVTWNLAFNPNEHNLSNVTITDILGPNQEYVPGSLTAIGGSYGPNGFVNGGQQLNPTVTTNGNQVIIKFPGNVTTAVDIYYRVRITGTNPDGSTTWTNHANFGSSEGNYEIDASTSWGGSGTGTGEQRVGSFTLTKTDATSGAALAGAEYELKDSNGNVIISNGTTDENGQLRIRNLPYGTYTLTEVRAPDGYVLNSTPIEFTIPTNGEIDLTGQHKDTAETGAVILKKLDPDSQATIGGATFNLLDSNGNVIREGLVTDGTGEISVSDLPAGNYQFVETSPADGYELNTTPIDFTVIAGQTTPVVLEKFNVATNTITNTGNILLTKVNAQTNGLLPGAIYNLLDSNGNILQSDLTTNENGQILISNLEAGTYSLVETQAPEGYQLNTAPIVFIVEKDQTNAITAKNNPLPTNPGEPGGPEAPGEGGTNPPTGPTNPEPPVVNPEEPGTTEPSNPEPPVVNPEEPGTTEPSTPEPPVVNPEEPGTTEPSNPEPPVVNPEEPGTTEPSTPEPPVVNPEEPGTTEPSTPEPPVVNPEVPGTGNNNDEAVPTPELPGSITTAPSPDEVLPPINNGSVGNLPSGAVSLPGSSSSSSYGKGTFPQTGNESGLLMMISGFFIALFVILRFLIKKLSY